MFTGVAISINRTVLMYQCGSSTDRNVHTGNVINLWKKNRWTELIPWTARAHIDSVIGFVIERTVTLRNLS
jgi:hypothetical protein